MKHLVLGLLSLPFALGSALLAQADGIRTKTTYAKAYGETKNAVTVDAAKDLPRYPAVEPKDAIGTWQVKKGFKLQLAAHEPQVRDPIAICFDESGRMFVCEMNDYSEMREVTPHMGRISMLQDKDGDGYFETSQVFADDLPWPTGLVWANGGLYVGATPDIWRFEDKDGDGKAEVREKVFTGFGTGLKMLNVQGLMNSFMWGQDNRIHVLAGGGNRGVVRRVGVPPATSASGILPDESKAGKMPATQGAGRMPDLQDGIELGGKDFWFDPLTHEFGLEGGGAQYGMSFDNYGRKFGCSNSDHLQYWVYDDKYANRNPYYQMPPARQSIAADGGAAEVFRISPDEPWRIIRTRWRIAGVVKGAVEGGGRVSGYFTGATGTTIYRGDAYGPEFVNNSFTGDAGGQLVHRKIIKPSADGISLVGERPADEHGFEFAASKDTWVRVVNFANAPDGCLHICDMYREVIEHPWSIPDEIKKHIDLNSGNDRGRIYRIVPDKGAERIGQKVNLANASTEELVKLLGHPNGWHRDTAQRLLYERQDKAAVPLLEKVVTSTSGWDPLAKLHALSALAGFGPVGEAPMISALTSYGLMERAWSLVEAHLAQKPSHALSEALRSACTVESPREAFHVMLHAPQLFACIPSDWRGFDDATNDLNNIGRTLIAASQTWSHNAWVTNAWFASDPELAWLMLAPLLDVISPENPNLARILELSLASSTSRPKLCPSVARLSQGEIIGWVAGHPRAELLVAVARGLRKAGTSIEKADTDHKFAVVFTKAAETALANKASESARLEAIELLGLASSEQATETLHACIANGQPDAIQAAALKQLVGSKAQGTTKTLLVAWPTLGPKARAAAMDALLSRDESAIALLEANVMKPADFSAAQVQALTKHKSEKVAAAAKTALASVIPPSREEMTAKFKPAIAAKGDAKKGQVQYMTRCVACHKAGTLGMAVGPDLITVKTKGREALLTAILEPHKEVASQFIAYTVNTKDGQTLAGIITNDTASSMTIRMMGGIEKTLQRSEIKGSSSTGQSLMPEGLETGMTVQDMADLISYIESL
ncbi:MAG: PVC-type heme-binding CxxCH protein [Prosthecobacter sp.]|uniref:PVC-type heme-binding CxxCH protein n=1 Tax=Prosthecobacter sp. TaxID=1965333 RepID=UPI0038FE1252